jgi:hypothetical protein
VAYPIQAEGKILHPDINKVINSIRNEEESSQQRKKTYCFCLYKE